MAFRIAPLRIPNMTTDYSGEINAAGQLGRTIAGMPDQWRKQEEAAQKKQLLGSLIGGGTPDYSKIGLGMIALGDTSGGAAIIGLGQKQKELQQAEEAYKTSPFSSSAPTSNGARPTAALGSPNEIENTFVGTVKQAGLTNPVGLGAVAAYGKAESGFSPRNVNRVWNDPSESGQSGQAGGIMSWRGPRLEALNAFARERGEQAPSPQTQALFLAKEDPTLLPRLNEAKTPQEANQIMANAWRFAGYNRPGGENARREALTTQYAQRYAGQGGQSQQQAAQPAPQGVQVAETEADVQRLEAGMPNYGAAPAPVQTAQSPQTQAPVGIGYGGMTTQQLTTYLNTPEVPPNVKQMMQAELDKRQGGAPAQQPQPGAPVQVAEAAPQPGAPVPDAQNQPAPGAAEAQFTIPGKATLPPNDPYPQVTDQKLIEVWRNPRSSPGDKALAERIWQNRQAYSAETAPDKREKARLETQKTAAEVAKLERENAGKGYRSLVTAEERAAAGVDPSYKGPAQVDRDNKLYLPGKATTEVNIDQKGETAYATNNGAAISKRFAGIVEEGDAARAEAAALAQIRQLGGQIKNMGSGAALQAKLAEYGIKVGENVSEIEAYGALVDKLTPQQRIAGAGATSDFDAKMFKNSLPGLMRTPGGNEIILNTLEALNAYKRQRADIAEEGMALNEKPAEVIKKLRELPDPFAAFKEARKASMSGQPAPAPSSDAQQAAPTQQQPPDVAPPPTAAEHLRANPALRGAFDQKYGAGSAAKILGQ